MGRIKGVPKAGLAKRIDEVMEKCAVADVRKKEIGKLSKGYRQRVGLAQAIIHNPDVLILDEPTAGLDPHQIIETRDLIKGLAGDHTIILSTHILPEVEHDLRARHHHRQGQAGGHRHGGEPDQPAARRRDGGGGSRAARRCGSIGSVSCTGPAEAGAGGRRQPRVAQGIQGRP